MLGGADEINQVSVRDLILFGGGLFLIYQSVREIHHLTESHDDPESSSSIRPAKFGAVLIQIALLDIVFSLDSVITAVGMVDHISVMVAAVVVSVLVMLVAAKPIGEFVDRHPSIKVLALAFLIMVGMALTAEAFDQEVPKGYIYAAMAFSLAVEALNIRARSRRQAKAASQP
jgi:predicted tellurium resistance membrane protein TerC